jgi:hypothetical protein
MTYKIVGPFWLNKISDVHFLESFSGETETVINREKGEWSSVGGNVSAHGVRAQKISRQALKRWRSLGTGGGPVRAIVPGFSQLRGYTNKKWPFF